MLFGSIFFLEKFLLNSRSLEEHSYEPFAVQNTQMPPDTRTITLSLGENDHRQTTDKSWSWFFLVIFVFWIACLQYAIIHHPMEQHVFSDTITDANNNISHQIVLKDTLVENNAFKFVHDKKGNESNPANETDPTTERKWTILFYFLFNLITCKPTHLPSHLLDEANWGYIAIIGAHAYIGLMYYICSLMSINEDKIFSKQPSIFCATFLFISLLEHLSAMSSVAFSLQSNNERLAYWVLPEAFFLIFCLSKILSRGQSKEENPLLPLPFYVYTIAVGIPVFVILELLIAFTVSTSCNLSWNSALFYMIIGGSCYVGLTIFYFGLMVISCAMRVSSDGPQSLWKDPLRAFFIVARYHFGTACYKATLMFPISHAVDTVKEVSKFLEMEKRIRGQMRRTSENPGKKKEKESRLTYRKIYSDPITLTAVYGTNYSRSLIKLLRFWSNDSFSKEYIYNYRLLIWYLFLLIMSINSFMIILLWFHGLDDSTFTLATWMMYIKMMVMYYLAMQCFKATSDAIVFCVYRKLEGPFENVPAEKLRINYVRVPNTKSYEVHIKLT